MKKLMTIMLVLVGIAVLNAHSFEGPGPMGPMMGMMGGPMMGMGHPMERWATMTPMRLFVLFERAEELAGDEVREKVKSLKEEAIGKLLRQRTEVAILHMQLKEMLEDPDFKLVEVKKTLKSLHDERYKLEETSINYLAKLRDILGREKFAHLFEFPPMEEEEEEFHMPMRRMMHH